MPEPEARSDTDCSDEGGDGAPASIKRHYKPIEVEVALQGTMLGGISEQLGSVVIDVGALFSPGNMSLKRMNLSIESKRRGIKFKGQPDNMPGHNSSTSVPKITPGSHMSGGNKEKSLPQKWDFSVSFSILTTAQEIDQLSKMPNCHSRALNQVEAPVKGSGTKGTKDEHLIRYIGTTDLDVHLVEWFGEKRFTEAMTYKYKVVLRRARRILRCMHSMIEQGHGEDHVHIYTVGYHLKSWSENWTIWAEEQQKERSRIRKNSKDSKDSAAMAEQALAQLNAIGGPTAHTLPAELPYMAPKEPKRLPPARSGPYVHRRGSIGGSINEGIRAAQEAAKQAAFLQKKKEERRATDRTERDQALAEDDSDSDLGDYLIDTPHHSSPSRVHSTANAGGRVSMMAPSLSDMDRR